MELKLYDKNNIDELPFIDNFDAKYAASYLVPMIKNGVEKYFDNVQGEMKILAIDNNWLIPVFVPAIDRTNAYVASIYAHYISYCYENDIIELYNNLYIQKYSHYNPKYNNEFAKLTGNNELLNYFALKDTEGKIVAILGYFVRQNVMTTPIFGYDFTFDKSVGLYRQISIKLFLEAKENGYILNSSSGVRQFKMGRGAERYWEYRIIYTKGINFYRRFIYKVLQFVTSKIGVPMMDKMKL